MTKIPKFKSEAEEARFWDTHDTTQFLDQMREATDIRFAAPKHKSMMIDVEPKYLETIKKIAYRKHIPYHTLIARWIRERLAREINSQKS